MTKTDLKLIALRLDPETAEAVEKLAEADGREPSAYILRLVRLHAAQAGEMAQEARERLLLSEDLIQRAVERARRLEAEGLFDERFTLTVLRSLFEEPGFLADYERAIGAEAMTQGLPAKASLNMSLGWHVKSAVRADALLDAEGKPRRAQVRGLPIQSYTLLTKPEIQN